MVPTEEARITLQMPYSAVPPMGIASARLAMLPPVNSDLFEIAPRHPIAPSSETVRHTSPDVSLAPFESPRVTLPQLVSQLFSGGKGPERPVHIRVGVPCQEMT